MIITQSRKNRISLNDYNYQWDIQQRIFLSKLSVFETNVLTEIIDGSLSMSIEQIAEDLNVEEKAVLPLIDKLCEIQLIQRQDKMIFIDKEMRKYYETHIVKFNDNFLPTLDFLQGLLNKVPIHILPTWYAIPKTSDHIFNSIIEKYMITPKTYSSYLKELSFDDPILNGIFHDIYSAQEFRILSRELREKYALTREQFIECMLHLEYYLVGCLSYERKGDQWEEVVTPFHEWREHLSFQKRTAPEKIQKTDEIKRHHPEDFGFIKDMNSILKLIQHQPLPIELEENDPFILESSLKKILPHYDKILSPKQHNKNLVAKILSLKLGKLQSHTLEAHYKSAEWLQKSLEEQVMVIYRHPGSCFRKLKRLSIIYTDRDMRETEKNLKRILHGDWVYFDDFMRGFTAKIGNTEAVILKNKGKHWHYNCPKYNQDEQLIIQRIVLGRLVESGIIGCGTHKDRVCIRLTEFGQKIFDHYAQ